MTIVERTLLAESYQEAKGLVERHPDCPEHAPMSLYPWDQKRLKRLTSLSRLQAWRVPGS